MCMSHHIESSRGWVLSSSDADVVYAVGEQEYYVDNVTAASHVAWVDERWSTMESLILLPLDHTLVDI